MSVTYTEKTSATTVPTEVGFVPSYARGSRKKKSVKTWMILAPIGAVALIGGGAILMLNSETDGGPLVEPANAPLTQPAPVSAPLESSTVPETAPSTSTFAATSVPTPVVREAPPAPPPVVRRRVTPADSRTAPAPTPRSETALEPAGLRPYSPSAATGASAPTPEAAPAPAISVAPLGQAGRS